MAERVYIETTIISYLASWASRDTVVAGRQVLTHAWWDERRGAFELVVSELVVQEASAGDADAATRRVAALRGIPSLELSPDAVVLAKTIVNRGLIPEEYAEDALHVAVCAVNGVEYLLTWNCRHLANAIRRDRLTTLIEDEGYGAPIICTPEELMED